MNKRGKNQSIDDFRIVCSYTDFDKEMIKQVLRSDEFVEIFKQIILDTDNVNKPTRD